MPTGLSAVKLGLAPIGKFVFSHEDALRYKQLIGQRLRDLGVNFVDLEGVVADGMLRRSEDLEPALRHFRAAEIDAVFCPHCNFGTEDVAALLGQKLGLPYLLWGPRDELPLPDGSRLRDTQCGLFATSDILRRLAVPFTYLPNCRMDDPILDRGLLGFLRVAAVCKRLRGMRIGQVGQRNDFFWTVMINEAELLEKFGIQVWQIYLDDVLAEVEALVGSGDQRLTDLAGLIQGTVTVESLDERQVRSIAALKLVLGEHAARLNLDALTFQCFPATQKHFGIYPCYAHGLLGDEGLPVICESDVHGAITAVMLHAAALWETPPFFADLTNRHPDNDNAELLWHCGAFPPSLREEGACERIGEHFIMPGAEAGVCHWRIKGGPLTVARFADDRGEYKLGFGHGEGTDGPPTVGTYAWMQVRDWPHWERRLIRGPYIHHVAGIHGHVGPILHEACRYIPHLQPDPIEPAEEELEGWWQTADA
jgi:L-fucose isomerase-like protein